MVRSTKDASGPKRPGVTRGTAGTRNNRKATAPAAAPAADRGGEQAAGSVVPTPSEADIARLAYEIYVGRGATNGHALDDWLEAERQLRGEPSR
jgi:hypothetical protein